MAQANQSWNLVMVFANHLRYILLTAAALAAASAAASAVTPTVTPTAAATVQNPDIANPVLQGSSQPAQTEISRFVDKPQVLLPEGVVINWRPAKLVRLPRDNRWFLIFDMTLLEPRLPVSPTAADSEAIAELTEAAMIDKPPLREDDPLARPIEVLPGKWLSAMASVVGNKTDLTMEFRVSGVITTYNNRNYILPTWAASLSMFGKQAAVAVPATKANSLEPTFFTGRSPADDTTAATNAGENSLSDAPSDALPDALREMLLAIPRTCPLETGIRLGQKVVGMAGEQGVNTGTVSTATIGTKAVGAGSPGTQQGEGGSGAEVGGRSKRRQDEAIWQDGYVVTDRVGRVRYYADEGYWFFSFEADDSSLAEPPVALHPCQLLEEIELVTIRAGETRKFRVSGEISKYQEKNYLLLHKLLVVYEAGNFGK